DFVVHEDYGIGKFAGLHKIKVRGAEQEVMKILYDENDTLYVNLNFVNRVQKYSSQEGHVPRLTKLGAPDWERLKSRARKRIKDIARELIALYARRKHEQGFAFSADSHWQKEMEASFMYEDTPDQAKATLDVKQDMENSSPMDRLICGDVGFGKTEVAVRAAFKAVLDGKQAAVLVPTTILAHQHCNTFLDRLGRYSVRVESLTRFKSKKEQKAILEALAEGKVDIVIGTHRLLSKDVQFKSLGLLVIDEEHRFGVTAKEKLRQLRATVDTLTLTATPIPRTLHFSLMGARDLSIINTPPRNRMPIITEIAQYDIGLMREAILKELHRGGQVYFVHDRIHNMEELRAMLEGHIPEARFHIAHGQMEGHELERTMMDFLERKYNVLICTKIIESGIDIPSVNTIIINRADRFGLAELYQLRGRVGRSNEQAYAYLITPPISSLPRASLRRLQAIQEFTELGSGFNLAMRDLEIRGAGNLLGAEQSGFIMEMGFETYQRIVEEAVSELKEQEFTQLFEGDKLGKKKQAETIIETDIEALIPDFYIESDSERLDIYRRLYKLESFEEIQVMREELQDRFGEYPEEIEHLFRMVEVKTIAAKLHFIKVELSGDVLALSFPPAEEKEFYEGADGTTSPFQTMMNRVIELKQYQARLKQEGQQLKLVARIGKSDDEGEKLRLVRGFLEKLK
ncbi:MAG: transcription-repair coupling factor, partial [Deltaproteobacteria bacterium]|nr:transcription-repair coupling factor [Deltaproteobacteria bacterium]